ncbi:signal peptidase I [Nitzschia inconspicua]|uniref:Mitochondrial inner membrane protease subunit n=1 Tax=Nitzschia inconspicua TaxID=303405 RepID=A0A9K3L0I0_9STRA|nr:signal peptidase I [Nitzschia inconspicua]
MLNLANEWITLVVVVVSTLSCTGVFGFLPVPLSRGNFFPAGLQTRQLNGLFQISNEGLMRATAEAVNIPDSNSNLFQRTNVTVSFPSFLELMDLRQGECIISKPFVCHDHQFCVKLYPRGGGHSSSFSNDGFGMAYKVSSPLKGRPEERVGMYLQYLGKRNDDEPSTVDVTFALRLKGRQRSSRKFDVEWRAGMRFVSTVEASNLQQGYANDFGAHLMQTTLFQDFLGISNDSMDDPTPVIAEVEVTIHDKEKEEQQLLNINSTTRNENTSGTTSFFGVFGKDIRQVDRQPSLHNTEEVRVGKIVVPILTNLSERPKMFQLGAYPGVEYRILRILKDDQERFTSCPGADYELKPIYPLVAQLERPWPVAVNEREIPRLYNPSTYNLISAVGSLFTAATGLFTAFVISQAISLFFIPSKSMDPTLQVGDVLLVDKVSPRVMRQQRVNDIILFSPPSKLQEIVAKSGGKLSSRDLFVKRIAAAPGDTVTVKANGDVYVNDDDVVTGQRDLCEAEPLRLIEKYIEPTKDEVIEMDYVFVMGDCSSVSVDSRVWGPLETKQIVGRPIVRLWPLEKFGPLK